MCSFLSYIRVAATYYLQDLFQITDLLRTVVLNMSLMECANKAARLHSNPRERGRLKVGFSFFLIVSPQEFRSCRKWALWNPVLRETGSGSSMALEEGCKESKRSRRIQGLCDNNHLH